MKVNRKRPLIATLIIILIIVFGGSIFIASMMVQGKRQSMDESWDWQMNNVPNLKGTIKKGDLTDYTVTGEDGYEYHVSYLNADRNSDRLVIFAHGYTDTRYGMLKYMPFYRDMGFHCVFFDERGHGENAPTPCSYGVKEAKGLLSIIRDTKERYGSHIHIGLHGESLGGATVLCAMGLDLEGMVDFAVDDCGYARIIPVLKNTMKMGRIPTGFVYPAGLAARIFYGVSFKAAEPVRYVKNPRQELPLLIIHGDNDSFIFPEHSKLIYQEAKGYKELHLIEGAEHAQSAIVAPDEYRRILGEFIDKVLY